MAVTFKEFYLGPANKWISSTISSGRKVNVERLSEKGRGLTDMDNNVVIAGGRGYKGTKW